MKYKYMDVSVEKIARKLRIRYDNYPRLLLNPSKVRGRLVCD